MLNPGSYLIRVKALSPSSWNQGSIDIKGLNLLLTLGEIVVCHLMKSAGLIKLVLRE